MVHMFLFGVTAVYASVLQAEVAISSHAEALSTIDSIHVTIETWREVVGQDPELVSTSESWRVGDRQRAVRMISSFNVPDNKRSVVPLAERRYEFSLGETEIRRLNRWNPSDSKKEPNDLNRNRLSQVEAIIDNRTADTATANEWWLLMLEVSPGRSLKSLCDQGHVVTLPSEDEDIVRFRIEATDVPKLEDAIIELDQRRGFMVHRIEAKNGLVIAVEDSIEFPGNVWIPSKVRRTRGEQSSVNKLTDCQVNEEIAASNLQVVFPEDVRVNDLVNEKIHIWGTDGPKETFDTEQELNEHLSNLGNAGTAKNRIKQEKESGWLLWLNMILLAMVGALLVIRRKMAK